MSNATATAAAVRTYTIDKTHSEVLFQVRHLVTRVRGRFTDFKGDFTFDARRPEESAASFTIDAGSIDTATPDRDAHLRGADFFDAETFPQITFLSSKVVPRSDGVLDVHGTLTIRGVSREIVLPVAYLGSTKDPWGNTRVGFEAETTINRKDFGLTWNVVLETGGFVVGDDVKITLSVQAVEM